MRDQYGFAAEYRTRYGILLPSLIGAGRRKPSWSPACAGMTDRAENQEPYRVRLPKPSARGRTGENRTWYGIGYCSTEAAALVAGKDYERTSAPSRSQKKATLCVWHMSARL